MLSLSVNILWQLLNSSVEKYSSHQITLEIGANGYKEAYNQKLEINMQVNELHIEVTFAI